MSDEITNLPECGGVAFADVYSKTGVRISVTGRGATTADAIDQLMAGIAYGVEKYHFVTDPTKIERPKPAEVLEDVQVNGRKRQTKPAPAPAVVADGPPGEADSRGNVPGEGGSIEVSKIAITPVQGGKAKLAFYPFLGNGNPGRYPDVYETRTVADWSSITNWDPDTFATAGEFMFNEGELTLTYEVASNQTSKGNYYLNFRELAFS